MDVSVARRGQIPLWVMVVLACVAFAALAVWTYTQTSSDVTADGRRPIVFWGGNQFGEDVHTVVHQFEKANPQYKVIMGTAAARDVTGDAQRLLSAVAGGVPPAVVVFDRFAIGGVRWRSDRTTYLAQHRPMSIIFQPPTFDDQTLKAKTWVPLVRDDTAGSQTASADRRATLRVILSPSSTTQAVYGKVQRNYARAFHSVPFWTYVGNSLLLVGLSVVGTLFSSTFVAYAFARLNWPGRGVAFVILLATMMLPGQVTMIPSFMIWRELGWYNTLNPLWEPAWFGGAIFIFLMVQHMKTIPRELEESARIDG